MIKGSVGAVRTKHTIGLFGISFNRCARSSSIFQATLFVLLLSKRSIAYPYMYVLNAHANNQHESKNINGQSRTIPYK